MFKITEPGIFYGVPAADYFADPMPAPSLTQSIAKVLIEQSPRHAWVRHPRLNPRYEPDDPTKFDIGNIAHSLLLGRGKEIEIIKGFDNWRKDAAQQARAAALAAGRHGVLEKDMERGLAMVEAAHEQIGERGYSVGDSKIGDGEVVVAAPLPGVGWCRAMIDWLPKNRLVVVDYKTTDRSAAPHAMPWRVPDGGWDIQAAMHDRLLNAVDPENAGRRKHRFIMQECDEPHALTIVELPESSLTMGRKKLAHAEAIWSRCMNAGTKAEHWPRYALEIQRPEYPGAAETAWLNREMEEAERA